MITTRRPFRVEDPICLKCAATRRTCCQEREIYVTPGDVRRIGAHAGRADFFEHRAPLDPSYLDQDDDPAWLRHVFREDGTRRVLRQRSGGDCTFLGERGCELPLDVRPLVCRLYPYQYDESGIEAAPEEGCPTHLLRAGETILTALGMDRRQAEEWRAQLYREIREEPR